MRLLRGSLIAFVLLLLVAVPARAVVPEVVVGGAGSRWFSGSWIDQIGQNCSILGAPYTETMVSGVGSYGGRPGVVKVGDQYWTSLLLSVPGNPCGVGSAGIQTELILPHDTAYDGSRQIRCFYLSRNATRTDQFVEVTGQTWSAFGSSGQICPAQPGAGMHQGALSIGYRPLVSGGMLQIFVPVRSAATLAGMGGPDRFTWVVDSTGVYANPDVSEVWANVFANLGSRPYVYFARDPSAIPFWKADAPTTPVDLRNRAEFFANFYVAGQPGSVSFRIDRLDTPTPQLVIDSSSPAAAFDGTVGAGQELIQILPGEGARGPNGGYAPFAFDKPGENGNARGEWNTPMRITWTFTPSGGGAPVSASQSFRTLPGPDADGDGVPDVNDLCPAARGSGADGCMPSAPPDPDGDGIFGALDRCPAAAAPGTLDGCPAGGGGGGGGTPPPSDQSPGPAPNPGPQPRADPPIDRAGPTPAPQLVATWKLKRGARLTTATLRRGARLGLSCSRAATATATLTVAPAVGRRLGLRGKSPVVARATVRCAAGARGATVVLKPARALLAKLARQRKPVPATLAVTLAAPGATSGGAKVGVRIG